MLPLLPPYPINEMAHEPREGRLPDGRPRRQHADPDGFLGVDPALQPDPLYMGLRQWVAHGPIGRLAAWFERRAEAREDRAANQRVDTSIALAERPAIEPSPRVVGDDPDEDRTAA